MISTCSRYVAQRKRCLLLPQEVHQLNISVLSKVPLQPLLAEGLEVLNVPDVNVPRRTRVDSKRKRGRKGARVLAPADLKAAVVEREALVRGHLEERERRGGGR